MIIHVPALKPFHEDENMHLASLPAQFYEEQPIVKPYQINKKWTIMQNKDQQFTQVLVQWEGFPKEDATWVPLEDKVVFQEGGNDERQTTRLEETKTKR